MATQYRKFPYVASSVSVGDVGIQFDLDGVATSVSKDTVTPTNSNPLPVEIFALNIVDFLDSGLVDTSSTPITTSGISIVASLGGNVKKITIFEDIGEFMALTDGTDAILSYLPLGGGEIDISIVSGTALKLKSLTGSSITSGKIAMNFLG